LLRELGLDVTVYERSGAELEQRGAGIGFLPASYRYLAERARIDLDEISISTNHIRYLDRQDRVIHDQQQLYRFSNWNTVYRSLLRCFGRERYLLGRECIDIRQEGGKVRIKHADGSELELDLLVCADGVSSQARAKLLPDVRPQHVAEMRATASARLPERIRTVVLAVEQPFVQVILDIEVPKMAFGHVCLIGDAGFVVRPHAAAGTAKAAADAWELAKALDQEPHIETALKAWEPAQLELGRKLLERTRSIGRRSQVYCNWTPGDPQFIFGLYEPGR